MEKKKNKKPQERQKYYTISIPKEDLEFFENLRISKSNFMKQACLSFLATIKKEAKMDLYFRTNNSVQNAVKKDNLVQDEDDRKF